MGNQAYTAPIGLHELNQIIDASHHIQAILCVAHRAADSEPLSMAEGFSSGTTLNDAVCT
jgi:hypothetical protein